MTDPGQPPTTRPMPAPLAPRAPLAPAPPPDAPRTTATVHLRFEDVTQDGRLVLEAMPNALGPAVWQGILGRDPTAKGLFQRGIVPILSRFVLEGGDGPLSAVGKVEAEGACALARAGDGRIVLDMWASLSAPIGRTYGPVDGAGDKTQVGSVFGEHVLTRPFAAPGERRVRDLDFPGAPAVRPSRPPLPPRESIATLPEGATPLEPAMRVDAAPVLFGLVHTDSNMHVNSLVYIRLFEEAALRRFAELGELRKRASVLGRTMEIAYRKPCFAGQQMRVVQQAFEADGWLGIAATLVREEEAASPEGLSTAQPHAFVRMTFG